MVEVVIGREVAVGEVAAVSLWVGVEVVEGACQVVEEVVVAAAFLGEVEEVAVVVVVNFLLNSMILVRVVGLALKYFRHSQSY